MRTSISSKGQVVLPAELRRRDHIRPGEEFDVERLAPGQYLLTKQLPPGKAGVIDWLLACPDKDWFCPLPSDSTDTI